MEDEEKLAPKEPTADELEAEKQQLEEVDEDDLRDKLAEELGIDPDEQEELLDKAVKRELDNRKKLSDAIGQKRKWREKATKTQPSEPKPMAKETEDVKSTVLSILEEERLNDMDVPEELKSEIRKIADINNVSVKKASQDPYILYKKEELENAAKAEDATISRKNKGVGAKFDPETIPDFDVSTPEGQKQWAEWKAKARQVK